MKKLINLSLGVAIATLSMSSSAELIATDWLDEGDQRAILDTETGIEWLDMNETKGLNIADLASMSMFDEWAVGNQSDVIGFMESVISSGTFGTFNNLTHNGNSFNSYSIYLRDAGDYSMAGFVTDGRNYLNYGSYNETNNRADFGIWLKSDGGVTLSSVNDPSLNINNANSPYNNGSASVPLTASISLLVLGLAGFARKKKK